MLNPLYMDELQEMPEVTEESRSKFQITDLSSLNWVLRKMTAIEAKRTEVNQLADNELERIEEYRKREIEGLERSADFFKSLITEYAIRKRDMEPKFKSEKTPYGSIAFRKQQPKWIYDDETLVSFLEQNERTDLVRIKKEPEKAEIKKRFQVNEDGRVFDENGQQVTGIKVEFPSEELMIKLEV
jgi:U3 small nucleolar RNA-associated protein 14